MQLIKKITLGLSLGFLSVTSLIAQKPQDLMARAEKALYTKGATIADFSSIYYDASGRELNRIAGKMTIEGESFRLEYGSIVAVYSAPTLSYHDSSEKTFTISEPSEEELLQLNPLHFLRSRAKGFTTSLKPATKTSDVLGFIPQRANNIKGIEIGFLRTNGLPSDILILGKDGGRLSVKITNVRTGQFLSKGQFTLKAEQFPSSEVVDLR